MLHADIKKCLARFEQDPQGLASHKGEYYLASEINRILSMQENYMQTKEDKAETMAFGFLAAHPNDNAGWGTYYGPILVSSNDNGETMEYPSIKDIDQEILEYWTQRANESQSPFLSSRYADLVVDFSLKTRKKDLSANLFHTVIDSNIAICENPLSERLACQEKIKRALTLSIIIKDTKRIHNVKSVILNYVTGDQSIDDSPGLWVFPFKCLLLDFSGKITITDEERKDLLDELEERLTRIKENPWLTEDAVSLLSEYYASQKDENNFMRVLEILEQTFKSNEYLNSNALLKSNTYKRIHTIYRNYTGLFKEAKKASERLFKEIGQLDLNWEDSMQKVSVETVIKQEQIEKYLDTVFGKCRKNPLKKILHKIFFGKCRKNPLKETLQKIFFGHLDRENKLKKEFDVTIKENPVSYIVPNQIISDSKVLIAELVGLDKHYDNHFQRYASRYVQFDICVYFAMCELQKRFSKKQIFEYFNKTVIFKNANKEYLKRAIFAYWDKDYLISSHLFIPLIENGIRELIKVCGGTYLKVNDLGGYDHVSLGRLLRSNKIFGEVFSNVGPDVQFYFKLVLVEKLGLNLRNNFAHGLSVNEFFKKETSDRLFHIMIGLSLVRKEEN